MIILFWASKTFWRNGMTLRQRRKLKKKQRRKVAPVCDFKKVSYLAGTILEQSSGYRCHCFLLCSFNKTKRFHVAMLPLRNSLQKTFFFPIGLYLILTSALICYWTNAGQHGIYLLNRFWLKLELKQAYGHYRL